MQDKLILNQENFMLFIKDLINKNNLSKEEFDDITLDSLGLDEEKDEDFIHNINILDEETLDELNIKNLIKYLIFFSDDLITDIGEDLINLNNDFQVESISRYCKYFEIEAHLIEDEDYWDVYFTYEIYPEI